MIPHKNFLIYFIVASLVILASLHYLPQVQGTADMEARDAQNQADMLSSNIRSFALFGLAPIFTGGASIFTAAKIRKAPFVKPFPLLSGLVVAIATFGLVFLLV